MNSNFSISLFCKRLKEARTNKKMTQKELSEKSGVSTVMISAYENEDTSTGKNPALSNVYAIAVVLGVSVDWLCGLSDNSGVQIDSITIDTEKFLYSIIELLNNDVSYSPIKHPNSREVIGYNIEIEQTLGNLISNFITDYLEVKTVIEKKLLPEGINETVIKSIVDKYKKNSVTDLFKDFDDDLPF